MPYISFKTNHKLTLRQENTIKSKSGELISLIPGKTEKALMIHMEDDQIMYFKGEETPCMMIEINLYKSAEFDDKKKLTEAMIQMIHETTKIEADNIYVIFHEFDHWGLNQTLISNKIRLCCSYLLTWPLFKPSSFLFKGSQSKIFKI